MKSNKINNVLLGLIALALIIIIFLLINKNKEVVPLTQQPYNQKPEGTPVKKDTPQTSIVKDIVNQTNLLPVKADPYTGEEIVGGAAYYLVKKPIIGDIMNSFGIYSNRKNGGPYNEQGKIYYNPTEQTQVVKFGQKASGDIDTFRESVNQKIKTNGYAVVSVFWDGGPDYTSYNLEK